MNKKLFDNRIIIDRRKGRSIRLKVRPDGAILLSAPYLISRQKIYEFIDKHQIWINKQIQHTNNIYNFSINTQIAPGLIVKTQISTHSTSRMNNGIIYINHLKEVENDHWQIYELARNHIKTGLKNIAQKVLVNELEYLANTHMYQYSNLRLRFMKSRWGSCKSNSQITLNTQLVRLPDFLREYVMIHELVHTNQMNHSVSFYQELSFVLPDYKKRIKSLREYHLFH